MSTPRAFLTTACFVRAEVKRLIALAGKDQVAVLELGKDIVRATRPIVETRSTAHGWWSKTSKPGPRRMPKPSARSRLSCGRRGLVQTASPAVATAAAAGG